MKEPYYPMEICIECGNKLGRPKHPYGVGVWEGRCGWCKKEGPVCAPRDFCYPEFKKQDRA